MRKKIALRIDDIGASTKKFEVYSKSRVGNFLFLKYISPFKAWAPYSEMNHQTWVDVLSILEKYNAKITIGITAAWVEKDGSLTPFPKKFPLISDVLKQGHHNGLIEIANHGLTHCIVGKHRPRMISSNRKYHREFWDWVPKNTHFEHIRQSQYILNNWLESPVTTLIPPGNVYSIDTVRAAEKYGIDRINSYMDFDIDTSVKIIDNENVDAFHDRDIVLHGVEWLEKKLHKYHHQDVTYVFVKNL